MQKAYLLRLTLLLLWLSSYDSVWGQQVVLTKVSPPEEVSWGAIVGMAQDQQGFLWLATQNGLFRYDGYRYVSFYHHLEDENSLASTGLQ